MSTGTDRLIMENTTLSPHGSLSQSPAFLTIVGRPAWNFALFQSYSVDDSSGITVGSRKFRRTVLNLIGFSEIILHAFWGTDRWPSGLRRRLKDASGNPAVFGRGFESHSVQVFGSIAVSIPACHAGDPEVLAARISRKLTNTIKDLLAPLHTCNQYEPIGKDPQFVISDPAVKKKTQREQGLWHGCFFQYIDSTKRVSQTMHKVTQSPNKIWSPTKRPNNTAGSSLRKHTI
ncbi:hypothetical protein CROQUDRAFT_97798 [Cronartium quercuum f. sp. fusiforme G11]|uniref:Uncharacterized protein n=1 Tax=Cronartium quercuum f. sp. fusiforme G11 TaxID=708437 RepID=A0A9P6N918_9BASI|nr:hypothetical protein CROQUDRAFT_97798 [Cronartium quercuum f. sp. fusiforme G11]